MPATAGAPSLGGNQTPRQRARQGLPNSGGTGKHTRDNTGEGRGDGRRHEAYRDTQTRTNGGPQWRNMTNWQRHLQIVSFAEDDQGDGSLTAIAGNYGQSEISRGQLLAGDAPSDTVLPSSYIRPPPLRASADAPPPWRIGASRPLRGEPLCPATTA